MRQNKNHNIKHHEYRKIKRTEAEERQAAWAGLTPKQQLQDLNRRLGKDVGAAKQRAKIEIKRRSAAQQS